MLEDNCDWFGATAAEKKVKALRIHGGERVRDLVDSLPEPEMEGDALDKTLAKLNAFFLPKKNTDVLVGRFCTCVKMIMRQLCSITLAFDQKL